MFETWGKLLATEKEVQGKTVPVFLTDLAEAHRRQGDTQDVLRMGGKEAKLQSRGMGTNQIYFLPTSTVLWTKFRLPENSGTGLYLAPRALMVVDVCFLPVLLQGRCQRRKVASPRLLSHA